MSNSISRHQLHGDSYAVEFSYNWWYPIYLRFLFLVGFEYLSAGDIQFISGFCFWLILNIYPQFIEDTHLYGWIILIMDILEGAV